MLTRLVFLISLHIVPTVTRNTSIVQHEALHLFSLRGYRASRTLPVQQSDRHNNNHRNDHHYSINLPRSHSLPWSALLQTRYLNPPADFKTRTNPNNHRYHCDRRHRLPAPENLHLCPAARATSPPNMSRASRLHRPGRDVVRELRTDSLPKHLHDRVSRLRELELHDYAWEFDFVDSDSYAYADDGRSGGGHLGKLGCEGACCGGSGWACLKLECGGICWEMMMGYLVGRGGEETKKKY